MTERQHRSVNQRNMLIPTLFLDHQRLKSPLQSQPQPKKIGVGLGILLCLLLLISTCLVTPPTIFAQTPPIKEDQMAIQNAHDFYYSQKYSEAVEAYQVLLKTPLHQHSKDAIRMNLGRSYVKLGDDAMALQSFHAVIDDDPDGSYASQAVHQIGALFRDRYQYNPMSPTRQQISENASRSDRTLFNCPIYFRRRRI